MRIWNRHDLAWSISSSLVVDMPHLDNPSLRVSGNEHTPRRARGVSPADSRRHGSKMVPFVSINAARAFMTAPPCRMINFEIDPRPVLPSPLCVDETLHKIGRLSLNALLSYTRGGESPRAPGHLSPHGLRQNQRGDVVRANRWCTVLRIFGVVEDRWRIDGVLVELISVHRPVKQGIECLIEPIDV